MFCFSWITTIITIWFLIFCFENICFTLGCWGSGAHTHRVNFYPQEASIVQPFQDKSRPSAVLYLSPQYLENSYPPQEISLVQQNILLIWAVCHHSPLSCTYIRNSAGAVCLFSPPADFCPFCRIYLFYPFSPVYIKYWLGVLNKDFSLQFG